MGEWIMNNWFNVVGILIIAAGAVFAGKKFMDKDKAQKIEAIREWLKYGVTVTERALGNGTGELKLRMLYSMLTQQFSYAAKLLTFEQFSTMVDEALLWMKKQLESNVNVSRLIEGDKING